MALSEQLILDTQTAFRELDALQGRLDNLSDIRLDITADTSGLNADLERSRSLVEDTASSFGEVNQQVTLTTDEYKRAVRAIDEGATASRAIAVATGEVADEAASAEDALRRVAQTMDISEDEARDLARSMGESTREATNLEADLRQVARSMGLSEDEARQFAAAARQGGDATKTLRQDSEGLASSWQTIRGLIITTVAAFGVRGLVRQFGSAIESANALGESINAVRVTFDEGAAQIEEFAQTAARSAGLAASQAQQLVIPIGALLRNFGFDAREAGDAAVTLTQRAADLASVFNTDVEEALTALGSALRGQSEPLRRFGGNITEARVQAFALAEGLADSVADIDEAVKVQARFALVMEDTARAQGDFAATSDQAANRTRIFQASLESARAEVGTALLPAFESLLASGEKLIPLLEDLAPVFGLLAEAVVGLADPLIVAADLLGVLIQPIKDIGDAIGGLEDPELDWVDQLNADTRKLIAPVDSVANLLQELGLVLTAGFDTATLRNEFGQLNDVIEAGVDPVEATADAYGRLAEQGTVTTSVLAGLLDVAGLTDEQLAGLLAGQLITAEGLGTTEVEALRDALDDVIDRLGIGRGAGRNFRGAGRAVSQELEEIGTSAEEAAARTAQMNEALNSLQGISEQSGLSVGFIARNIADFDADLIPLVNDLGAASIEAEAFARAMGGLAAEIEFDFQSAVDEFDLLISKTNEAGEEVPATVEEMIADIQEQAERFARLEAATTILEALGLDDLAAELRSQGPAAADAAEALVGDIERAFELESLFDEGGTLSATALEGLREGLRDGDITPELLGFAEQMTSSQVQRAIAIAALEDGTLFGAELQRVLDALDLNLQIRPDILLNELQFGGPPGTPGAVAPSGGGPTGGTGGGVTVQQEITFNDTPSPTTDTQRIITATESAIKNLGPR